MADGDAQLARRAAKGDETALEALYRRYVDRVWGYAWHRTHSREEAADIVQETFLRVVRSIRQFKGHSTLATWLFAVTRSVAVERARREGRNRPPAGNPGVLRLIPAASDVRELPAAEEARDATRKAVAGLPGAQRDAIVLCDLSGFRVREAAEVLGWNESRVKVTLFRARRRLRERLRPFLSVDAAGASRERAP